MVILSRPFTPPPTGIQAGTLDIEQEVLINENGTPVTYIVVHQGRPSSLYDASCDGTWLLRKDIKENGQWNSSNVNTLAGSTIMNTMAGYVNEYDPRIQAAIKTVKIPYCVGGGNTTIMSGANGLSCKIFPLSGKEVGWDSSDNQYFPNDGAKLAYFLDGTGSSANQKRVAKLNGSATYWCLRSPLTSYTYYVWGVFSDGGYDYWNANNSYGVRPAFILPSTFVLQESEVVQ